jgi:hypothetical protein
MSEPTEPTTDQEQPETPPNPDEPIHYTWAFQDAWQCPYCARNSLDKDFIIAHIHVCPGRPGLDEPVNYTNDPNVGALTSFQHSTVLETGPKADAPAETPAAAPEVSEPAPAPEPVTTPAEPEADPTTEEPKEGEETT